MHLSIANLALLGVLAAMLYAILRRVGSPLGATVGCLVMLLVFAFGRFNFICPYTHSATHGLILGVAAICFIARYHVRSSPAWTAAAGFSVGLAFLTKPEMFVAAAGAVASGLLLAAWANRFTAARLARAAGLVAGCAGLPALAAWALFRLAMPSHEALRGALGSCWSAFDQKITRLPFYTEGMGLNDVAGNLSMLLRSALVYGALLVPGAALTLSCRRYGRRRQVLAAALFTVPGALWLWRHDEVLWDTARPWPLFMAILAAAGLVWFVKTRRSPGRGAPAALAVTITVFALALLLKMLLYSRIFQYGFALALPAGVVMVVALLDWVPRLLDRAGGFGNGFRALAATLILIGVCWHVGLLRQNVAVRQVEIGSGADVFRVSADAKAAYGYALKLVESNVAPSQTLALLPTGVLLNYLSRRANPTPYTTYIGVDLEAFGDGRMTESYRRHPPDFIMLIHRPPTRFGPQVFGGDYGVELHRWILSNYDPVEPPGAAQARQHRPLDMVLLRHRAEGG